MNYLGLILITTHLIIASCQQVAYKNDTSPTTIRSQQFDSFTSNTSINAFSSNVSNELTTTTEDFTVDENATTVFLLDVIKVPSNEGQSETLNTKTNLTVVESEDVTDSRLEETTIPPLQHLFTTPDPSLTTTKINFPVLGNLVVQTTTREPPTGFLDVLTTLSIAPQNLELPDQKQFIQKSNSSQETVDVSNNTMQARSKENVSITSDNGTTSISFSTILSTEFEATTLNESSTDAIFQTSSTESILHPETTPVVMSPSTIETTTQEPPKTSLPTATTTMPTATTTMSTATTTMPTESTTMPTAFSSTYLPSTVDEEVFVKGESYMLVLKADCPEEFNQIGIALSNDPEIRISNCSSSFKMNLHTDKNSTIAKLDAAMKDNTKGHLKIREKMYEIVHIEKYVVISEKKEPFNFQSKEFILFVTLGCVLGTVVLIAVCLLFCRCFKCCCKKSKGSDGNFSPSMRMSLNMDEFSESRIPRPMTYGNDRNQPTMIRNSFSPPFAEVREEGMVQSFDTSVVPLEDGRILDDMITLREGRGGTMRTFNSKRDSWMNNNMDDHLNSTDRLHVNSDQFNRGFGNPTYGRISTPIV